MAAVESENAELVQMYLEEIQVDVNIQEKVYTSKVSKHTCYNLIHASSQCTSIFVTFEQQMWDIAQIEDHDQLVPKQ